MYLFFKNKVTSLSLVTFFLPKVISPIPEKVKSYYKLAGWIPPKDKNSIANPSLGAIGYYGKFIYNFAQIAYPLFQ